MPRRENIANAAKFAGLGFSLGATVIAAIWAGNWLDQRWGTSPLFLLLLLVGGMVGFLRRLLWMSRGRKGAEPADPGPGSGSV